MTKKILSLAIPALLALSAPAEWVYNAILDPTTPAGDRANLSAPAGQLFKTGTLGGSNQLDTVQIQAPDSSAQTTSFYVAIYQDADENTATWGLGDLIAVSTDSHALATANEVVTWNFNTGDLENDTVYALTFTTDPAGTQFTGIRCAMTPQWQSNAANAPGVDGHTMSSAEIIFTDTFDIAATVDTQQFVPPPPFSITIDQTSAELPRFGRNQLLEIEIYCPTGGVSTVETITASFKGSAAEYVDRLLLVDKGSYTDINVLSTVLADAPATDAPVTLPAGIVLQEGFNRLCLAVVPKRYAAFGSVIDARIDNVVLSGHNAGTIVPENSDPAGEAVLAATPYSIDIRIMGAHGLGANYRIPGIACDADGVLHAVYDNRYGFGGDLPGNVDVAYNRSLDGGVTWEAQKLILDFDASVIGSSGNGVGDPCILYDPVTDTLWVAALWSFGNNAYHYSGPGLDPTETGQYVLTKSTDGGETWSAPINITANIKDPAWNLLFQGPGHGLAMRDGTLVFPSQVRDGTTANDGVNQVRACSVYSTDHGETWQFGSIVPTTYPEQNENTVCELDDGRLLFSCRTPVGSNGQRAWAHYTPGGEEPMQDGSWSNLYRLAAVPDPVCQGSVIQWKSTHAGHPKEWILFANPATGGRNGITLRVSFDGGLTWPISRLVYAGPSAYSSLCILPDNSIGLLYEKDNYHSINFVRIEEEWLLNPEIDTDGDGLPDVWEQIWGTAPNTPDAEADPDGDGLTNAQEHLAGTDPNDNTSRFHIHQFLPGTDSVELQWQAIPGKSYQIQQSDNLTVWSDIPDPIVQTTSAHGRATIPVEEGIARRFYRTIILP